MKKIIVTISLLLTVTGCVPQGWVMTDSKNSTVVGENISVTFPVGWMQTKLPQEQPVYNKNKKIIPQEIITATRDGIGIQTISAVKRFNKFAFPSIEKKLSPDMLPSEVADLYVTDLRRQSGLERLRVVSTKPVMIGKKHGFRSVVTYKNKDGLRIMRDTYGFVDNTGLYMISYSGPYLYYYRRDAREFARTVRSFHRLKTATAEAKVSGFASMFVAK